ncbi:MAG: amino acid permease [Planctomycetes bacterium]|nr:amino acid permease [Planctomycetota bacterium]
MVNQLFATKSADKLIAESEQSHGLKRQLTALNLVMLGIGAIIGTGIFTLTGIAAANNAGPAVCLSFVVAGVASVFAALCYAEMASMIPIAGSAYTYSYATMGELVAWIIGWDLILEYLVGAATVSVGWSGYVTQFVEHISGGHIRIPSEWSTAPILWIEEGKKIPGTQQIAQVAKDLLFNGAQVHVNVGQPIPGTEQLADHGFFFFTGAIVNVPAIFITLMVTALLVRGVKESARFNNIVVFIKVAVVLAFIAFASKAINTANWDPFIPPNTGKRGEFGASGIFMGATTVFFAYIGFDAVSTAAQETKNPKRDLPIGILGSLAVCTVLYLAVALVLTGVVNYTELKGIAHPVGFGAKKAGMDWLEYAVEIGAIAGLSSVMLVMLMGQPRIFYSMANDGLFPAAAAKIHPKFGTPYVTTIITGVVCAAAGGILPIDILGELCSIGTLFAFVLVSLGVMILRIKRPDLNRGFMVPGGPYIVPILGAVTAGGLMFTGTTATIIRLFAWMAVGLIIYFAYGKRHSKLAAANAAAR